MFLFFIPTPDLRDALADQRKILHADQYWTEFYNAGPKFQRNPPQKIKNAKFYPILDDFKVWRQLSPEWLKVFEIWQVHFLPRFLPHWVKKVWWTLVH